MVSGYYMDFLVLEKTTIIRKTCLDLYANNEIRGFLFIKDEVTTKTNFKKDLLHILVNLANAENGIKYFEKKALGSKSIGALLSDERFGSENVDKKIVIVFDNMDGIIKQVGVDEVQLISTMLAQDIWDGTQSNYVVFGLTQEELLPSIVKKWNGNQKIKNMFDIPFIWEENEIYGLLLHQLKYLYEIESDNEDSIIQNYIINANSENSIDEIKKST